MHKTSPVREKVILRDTKPGNSKVCEDKLHDAEQGIEWSNLIFLPFHPVFQKIVLVCVIVKTYLGPLQSVDSFVRCWHMDKNNDILVNLFIVLYSYVADTIYGFDTLLHILHRQVTDKAMRREYMPKSAFLLLLDILSLIPFYRLVAQDTECSGRTQIYPNILTYNEFLIIYRVWEYYKLTTTHSYPQLILGFVIIMYITVNFLTVFMILLTYEGLCPHCNIIYPEKDWRSYVLYKMNKSEEEYPIYTYAVSLIFTHGLRRVLDNILPCTVLEFMMSSFLTIAGYGVLTVFILPKAFGESVLRLKNVCLKYPSVKKIIEETKRRNPSHKAYQHVETYYTTMWRRRSGIVHMPDIMEEMPRYLRLSIKQDLFWPLFYHSPTLRRTSPAFKRFLFEHVHISYKLPGEKFYAGSQCLSNLYFVKSGVVQLISADDGTTPILSVTSGTIFGDVNFLIPHPKRKVAIRCLTYCEVLFLAQVDLLLALHKFPEDRKNILKLYNYKIKHAKKLFASKEVIKGIDRSDAECIGWIKFRWWQIFEAISAWRKKMMQSDTQQPTASCELPPETSNYHCAKYIGQLVLCTDGQLQTKSMFVNYRFPWILSPYSVFGSVWKRIVICTVFIALFIYPHYIVTKRHPRIISFILLWIDIVYIADLCVSLMTSVKIQENETPNFYTIMLERCKSFNFIMDITAAIWIEQILTAVNIHALHYIVQFNRLLKVYVLFSSHYIKWDINKSPIGAVCRSIILLNICFITITSYFVYEVSRYYPEVTFSYFFGESIEEIEDLRPIVGVIVHWTFEFLCPSHLPKTNIDIDLAILVSYVAYIVFAYCKGKFLAYLYLRYKDTTDYQYFVVNLKNYYNNYGINKDLLRRLEKYLVCHYKYYKGLNVMDRDSFKHEAFEIYWKVQGEVAQKIIGESKVFKHADPSLIRELACVSKYVILPKHTSIIYAGSLTENVTWVVQGYVKSEDCGPNSELRSMFYEPGQMLSVDNVLLETLALKTYTCYTDCEILYINKQEFFQIYKRYPVEWYYLKTVKKELRLKIEEAFKKELNNFTEYKLKHELSDLRLRSATTSISETHQQQFDIHSTSDIRVGSSSILRTEPQHRRPDYFSMFKDGKNWKKPESKLMQTWLLIRAITVCVSITNASLKGGIGVQAMWTFEIIGLLCDIIAWIDIILKLFLNYHDSRGLLIKDNGKCLLNYLTKGFLMDIIGALPWFEVLRALMSKNINWNDAMLINTCCKFAHIYILFAYFNYISDLPTVNVGLGIVKWQLINILIAMGASQYLMSQCVDYNIDYHRNLIDMKLRNSCWMPKIFTMPEKLDSDALNLIFTQSIFLAECGMMSMNIGGFVPQQASDTMGYVLIVLGAICWIISCYTLSILVLSFRENTLFQNGVGSLDSFLRNERVEYSMIDKAIAHFRYCWMRTKGINIQQLLNKRIGMVFGQDLTYACYKTTYEVLGTLLNGGESMQKQLARISTINYFLPGHDIMREMDLVANLFVVHRGRVILKKNGKKIITLTKGDIFGQLIGTRLRPVRISAAADTHADVLQVPIKGFQEIITDEVRSTISKNDQSRNDFLATKTWFVENPYHSIEYILRSKKAIHLPWMPKPIKAHHRSWYSWWLYCTWFVGPCITAFIVVILPWTALPNSCVRVLYVLLTLLDILHVANVVCEFYSANIVVDNNRCVRRIIGFGIVKKWEFYLDALSLIIPLFNLIDNDRRYQLAKLLRLKWFIDFEYHFCRGFKTKLAPRALKGAIILLLLHLFTCGWIYVACSAEKFPLNIPDLDKLNVTVDLSEWAHPDHRKSGCARPIEKVMENGDRSLTAFVVPVYWLYDYVIAMSFVLLIHTHTSLDAVMAITINQVYYKIFITFALYLLDIWLLAFTVSALYSMFRNMYFFDYQVMNLTTFLKDSGLCPSLTKVVRKYTEQLWKNYRGNWLPELTYQGPACLREDLFVTLYIDHLNRPSTFRELPFYFKRQLAARLERTVIFPGKYIVQQGDVFNVTYFIHEGEVEKWSTNADGEEKFVSLLYPNGYFGCIPGIFSTGSFQFSYYTRTVVDLVYLRLQNWADLLEGYPDIKKSFIEATRALKHEGVKVAHVESWWFSNDDGKKKSMELFNK